MPDVKLEQSLAALQKILETEAFRTAPQLQKFLRYVVEEELAGRGDQLKAYNIAVDALGRPESFDAQKDPVVRVQAGRLRKLLATYYAGDGANEPLRIELPKGSYRPRFSETASADGVSATGSTVPGRPVWISAAVFLAVALTAVYALYLRQQPAPLDREEGIGPPIVEIGPLESHLSDKRRSTVEGFRRQLISILSNFRSIRIRERPETTKRAAQLQPASYRIDGIAVDADGKLLITLTVTETEDRTLLWNKSFFAPAADGRFDALVQSTVPSIVSELASISGVLSSDAIRRLRARLEQSEHQTLSAYECVLMFSAYDLGKRPEDGTRARECLKQLTASGSQNGSVWAAWSFMQFLDWSENSGSTDDPLIERALVAARRAIRLDPTDAKGHEYLGSILLAQGKYDDALKAYNRAVELNPANPDLHVLLGWHEILEGDWTGGILSIRRGVGMAPAAPGWMRIPLSIYAFRQGDYETALSEAETIVQSGDQRGLVLALAAAIALGDPERVAKHQAAFVGDENSDPTDPMGDIRSIFDSPEVLEKYERILSRADLG